MVWNLIDGCPVVLVLFQVDGLGRGASICQVGVLCHLCNVSDRIIIFSGLLDSMIVQYLLLHELFFKSFWPECREYFASHLLAGGRSSIFRGAETSFVDSAG